MRHHPLSGSPVIRVPEIRITPNTRVTFQPSRHKDCDRLASLMPHAHDMQALAAEYGVNDIFQDSGGKLLQVLIRIAAQNIPGRTGSDIIWLGSDTELKTLNTRLGNGGFTTHRQLDATVLARYRSEPWVFCMCDGIEVVEGWWVHPANLEPVFLDWEERLEARPVNRKFLNNPKIPRKLVQETGCYIDMSATK